MSHRNCHATRRHIRPPACGFTLTEMLMVVMVLAVLVLLAVSGLRAVTSHARRTTCAGNLCRLGKALRLYSLQYQGRYPETGAASTMGEAALSYNEFPDTWDSAGTGQWPQDRHTGNAGCLYLLIRLGLAAPADFVCQASGDRPALGIHCDERFSFFSFQRGTTSQMTAEQQQFLQLNATRHCSYSYQNMLGHEGIPPNLAQPEAGAIWTDRSPADLAILADHNPYTQMLGEGRELLCPLTHPQANSLNHGGEGQNVLYLGGDVRWQASPLCGARLDDGTLDNIYLPARGRVNDGHNVPRHVRDSYLVP